MNLAALGGFVGGLDKGLNLPALVQQHKISQQQAAAIAALAGSQGVPPPQINAPGSPAAAPGGMPGAAPAAGPVGAMGALPGATPMPGRGGAPQGPAPAPGGAPQAAGPPAGAPAPPPTSAAANGGLSGEAAPTGNPYQDARQTLQAMTKDLTTRFPNMKGSQLFGVLTQELALMKGVEPEAKDTMMYMVKMREAEAKWQDAQTKVGSLEERIANDQEKIATMQAAIDEKAKAAADRDQTQRDVARTNAGARVDAATIGARSRTDAAGINAGARVDAANIGARSRVAVGQGHDQASRYSADTRAGAQRDVATTNAGARAQSAGITAGQKVPAPPGAKRDPDGTTYEKGGRTWVKQGGYLVPG